MKKQNKKTDVEKILRDKLDEVYHEQQKYLRVQEEYFQLQRKYVFPDLEKKYVNKFFEINVERQPTGCEVFFCTTIFRGDDETIGAEGLMYGFNRQLYSIKYEIPVHELVKLKKISKQKALTIINNLIEFDLVYASTLDDNKINIEENE